MGLSNGFGGAAGGGGVPAIHGTTHVPGGADAMGSLAGQSIGSTLVPPSFQDGSVWIPTDALSPLRGKMMKWHAWRNTGSGRWVSEPFPIEYGSDNADGTFLELASVGPSGDVGFPFDADGLILGIRASRANDGPATKMFYLILDGNIAAPIQSFSISRQATFAIHNLDVAIPAGSILGVRAEAGGDPCMAAVVVEAAWRKDP